MKFQLTTAGKALLNDNPGGVVVTSIKLGDAYNYNLASEPTGLQGTVVFTRTDPINPVFINVNTWRYTMVLDNTIGSFNFGEAAAYVGTTLFGVGVNDSPIVKEVAIANVNGNSISLDLFVTNDSMTYTALLDVGNSDNNFRLPSISLPDNLVPPADLQPNTFIISGLTANDIPYLAIVDNQGQWAFTNRPKLYYSGAVSSASNLAVNTNPAHGLDDNTAIGHLPASAYVLQFTSGSLRGYCRELNDIGEIFFAWNTPTNRIPLPGDQFIITGPGPYNVTIGSGDGSGDAPVHLNEVLGAIGSTTQSHAYNQVIWRFGANQADRAAFYFKDYNSQVRGVVLKLQGDISDALQVTDASDTKQIIAQGTGELGLFATNSKALALGTGSTTWLGIQPVGAWAVNGQRGTLNQVLTSQGPLASPIWADFSVTVPPHNLLQGLQGGETSGYGAAEYYHVSQKFYNWSRTLLLPMTPGNNDVLQWNGANWINNQLPNAGAGGGSVVGVTFVTGTAHVIDANDLAKVIECSNTGTTSILVPSDLSNGTIQLGFNCLMAQRGTGQIVMTADSGVTIDSPETLRTRKQNSTIAIIKMEANRWRVSGDLEAL